MAKNTDECDVLLVGTGALASNICCELATQLQNGINVLIVGREGAKAQQLCLMARTMGALSGRSVHFGCDEVDLDDLDRISSFFTATKPRIILNCASLQSPWEGQTAPSRWTDVIARAGLGLTLPFQAVIAHRLLTAASDTGIGSIFLNACYPDAVNPFLKASGIPFICGVGNVATIAAFLQDNLGSSDTQTLRVLAHHAHLHPANSPNVDVRAWLDDRELEAVGTRLIQQRRLPRVGLHRVTAMTAALLIRNILARVVFCTNLPGPFGLPGGYPVRHDNGRFEIDLPGGVGLAEAISWNQRAGQHDGLMSVEDGVAVFTTDVTVEIEPFLPEYSRVLYASDMNAVFHAFDDLRERLRKQRGSSA